MCEGQSPTWRIAERQAPLLALRRALPGKLTLTEADLFEPGSFDDVVKGADFVFHTASNVIFDSPNPEKDLIEPAVKGTGNVLRSAASDSPPNNVFP